MTHDNGAYVKPADARYQPKDGAVCVHCAKPATLHCPICGKDFCDGPNCVEIH